MCIDLNIGATRIGHQFHYLCDLVSQWLRSCNILQKPSDNQLQLCKNPYCAIARILLSFYGDQDQFGFLQETISTKYQTKYPVLLIFLIFQNYNVLYHRSIRNIAFWATALDREIAQMTASNLQCNGYFACNHVAPYRFQLGAEILYVHIWSIFRFQFDLSKLDTSCAAVASNNLKYKVWKSSKVFVILNSNLWF